MSSKHVPQISQISWRVFTTIWKWNRTIQEVQFLHLQGTEPRNLGTIGLPTDLFCLQDRWVSSTYIYHRDFKIWNSTQPNALAVLYLTFRKVKTNGPDVPIERLTVTAVHKTGTDSSTQNCTLCSYQDSIMSSDIRAPGQQDPYNCTIYPSVCRQVPTGERLDGYSRKS